MTSKRVFLCRNRCRFWWASMRLRCADGYAAVQQISAHEDHRTASRPLVVCYMMNPVLTVKSSKHSGEWRVDRGSNRVHCRTPCRATTTFSKDAQHKLNMTRCRTLPHPRSQCRKVLAPQSQQHAHRLHIGTRPLPSARAPLDPPNSLRLQATHAIFTRMHRLVDSCQSEASPSHSLRRPGCDPMAALTAKSVSTSHSTSAASGLHLLCPANFCTDFACSSNGHLPRLACGEDPTGETAVKKRPVGELPLQAEAKRCYAGCTKAEACEEDVAASSLAMLSSTAVQGKQPPISRTPLETAVAACHCPCGKLFLWSP